MATFKERVLQNVHAGQSKIHHVKDSSDKLRKLIPWDQFSSLQTEYERIEWLWTNSVCASLVRNELEACIAKLQRLINTRLIGTSFNGKDEDGWKCLKNEGIALQFKERGNKLFGTGGNSNALEMYTEALLWVPEASVEAAIIYANRSAALFHLDHFQLALADIQLAQQLGYPKHLMYKLHERAGRCYLAQGDKTKGRQLISQALQVLDTYIVTTENAVPDVKLKPIKVKLESLLQQYSSDKPKSAKSATSGVMTLPKLCNGSDSFFQNASKKIKMEQSPEQGRYFVASQPISPGDVLVVEKAYISAMTSEYIHRQCSQCFAQIIAPIPCKACSFVSYCSVSCREEAWKSYHRFECSFSSLLAEAGVSITSTMALRLVTKNGPATNMLEWFELPEFKGTTLPATDGAAVGTYKAYPANEITSFLGLVFHSSQRTNEDWFQRSFMSIFLLALLKISPIFFDGASANSPMDEIKIATIIMRSLQILQFNAHEIAGWDSSQPKSYFLGGAVFPTLALLNHSCNPAIVRYFINDIVIVHAIRTILPGEQVTENYGPLYTTLSLAKRQSHLKTQYWFTCTCEPCTQNWPCIEEMNGHNSAADSLRLRCGFCRSPLNNPTDESSSADLSFIMNCPSCKKPTNLIKTFKLIEASEDKFHEGSCLLQSGQLDKAKQVFEQLIKFFDSTLVLPFKDYHLCQEGLRKCILPLGNQTQKYW